MSETLREILEDIRHKLNTSVYQNEEHVRLSLVARVVQALGWDIWNPKEVNTEFKVAPNEDNTKVDMALFVRHNFPDVLIEIKAVGKMEGNLEKIEMQARNYNIDLTALFSIITDGRFWRFYYARGGGNFSQKLFDNFDLLNPNISDHMKKLENYISKDEIQNGNAEDVAKKKLNVTLIQEAMTTAYQEAEQLIHKNPLMNLADALVTVMSGKRFTITQEEAVAYIRSRMDDQPTFSSTYPANDIEPPTIISDEVSQNQRGSVPAELKVRNKEIEQALLLFLSGSEHGKSAKDIEDHLFSIFKSKFESEWWQTIIPTNPRWKHRISAVKSQCVKDGLVMKDPEKAGWVRLTEKGKRFE